MTAQPVEWVLAIFYGPAAHRATYGRRSGTRYTKDYIQLSRKGEFIRNLRNVFVGGSTSPNSVSIEYVWPTGSAHGDIVFQSADRPHLKWETSLGAPKPWRMSLNPTTLSAETIPGDPSFTNATQADAEFSLISSRGAGQPYLLAVKLKGESNRLHLRVVLKEPSPAFFWADLNHTPQMIRELVAQTSQNSAIASSVFNSGGILPSEDVARVVASLSNSQNPAIDITALDLTTRQALASYLNVPAFGLYFDPAKKDDAWLVPNAPPAQLRPLLTSIATAPADATFVAEERDAIAETLEISVEQVNIFRSRIQSGNYEVEDTYASTKTRGSAQKVFSEHVKNNYEYTCAVTGIKSREFLIASHIVPWSIDKTIRLDPSNGICLSLLIDCAFENGFILIEDDLTIRLNLEKIQRDPALRAQLQPYDGLRVAEPSQFPPNPTYLQRRRAI